MADTNKSGESAAARRRRHLANRSADRLMRKSKSPKRPGTPEPERRVFSDESDPEEMTVVRRTRSRERPPKRDTTTEMVEDDFEIIRNLHKAKEIEDEIKENQRVIEESKFKIKEETVVEPKEMPPLIIAPKETKTKPKRPKTLPLIEESPKVIPRSKPKEKQIAVKSKLILKPKEEDDGQGQELQENLIEKPEPHDPAIIEDKSTDEKKSWFFQRWFSQSNVEENKEPEEIKTLPESEEMKVVSEEIKTMPEETREFKETEETPLPTETEPESSEEEEEVELIPPEEPKKWFLTTVIKTWKDHIDDHPTECAKLLKLKKRCQAELFVMIIYCGLGAMVFKFIEGSFESFYKCGVKRVKRDFIDSLWSYSQYMTQEDWKSQARRKLMAFENELHIAHEAGMTSYSGQKAWSFINAVIYCISVVTTIGYGHISPATITGQAITIVYAIFGIPVFLILLADFGKLFTRGIKFIWVFVRRLYYTGSCKRVRKTAPVQEVMKGVQLVYDFAAFRRPSQIPKDEQETGQSYLQPPGVVVADVESPVTPSPSQFEIDDEFNLPISVAITILIIYIFVGASLYAYWEEWTFFQAFYFVFVSMSTIGFGDVVPKHPMYMMSSIVYLVFGLALTSMCINVIQEKLSDTFRQASAKIGATIGLGVAEDEEEEGENIAQTNLDNKNDKKDVSTKIEN